ncbi:MAG TPA: 2-C-methyl-D-erythritol 4-phosphate cytidylyltransferase [Bacillota bacterium]|nr:2-C-methyl-D-erythritol 4-phosphate cytidylyltransferase [Bacillota bacterium]
MDNKREKIAAIIPAAGTGKRMAAGVNKIWLLLDGAPVLSHTLNVFQSSPLIDRIVLVVNQTELSEFKWFLAARQEQDRIPVDLVVGGVERQDSVAQGLHFLNDYLTDNNAYGLVVVHDAARALLTPELLAEVVEAGLEYRAVALGVPVKDTIKYVEPDGFVLETPERSRLWAVQTPQVFDFELLASAYQAAAGRRLRFTDDCSVVEYFEHPVKLIMGSYENIKITTPEDLVMAEAILGRRKNADRTGV